MIIALNSAFNRLGVIKNTISSTRSEELNGENVLDFEAVLDFRSGTLIGENTIYELDDDWFDTAFLKKSSNEDGTVTVSVESQHVSYRLNDPLFDMDFFTYEGTPAFIFGKILEGTGFTSGGIEFSDVIVYSAQEKKSRRQLLMEFAAYLGGDLLFNKFEISILQHRGSSEAKLAIKDRNVKLVSKTVNKREKDKDGNAIISYDCEPLYLPGDDYVLGDEIRLIQHSLGTDESLRVVRFSRDPYEDMSVTLEFANSTNGLEESMYHIGTDTVRKDKIYNGTRIGPNYGFENIRSDKKARSYFRADEMKFQTGDGSGENWRDRLYFEVDPDTGETTLMLDGKLATDMISSLSGELHISEKASQNDLDILGAVVATHTTEIEQNANAISLKAETSLVNTVQATANAAVEAASDAQDAADLAHAEATQANGLLSLLSSDSKLTPTEKKLVRKEWDVIVAEVPVNDTQATTFGITTQKVTYDAKYTDLTTYLGDMLSDVKMGETTDVIGSEFRGKFKAYYDARTALLNVIAGKAKTLADAAQATANAKRRIFTVQPTTPYDVGDVWAQGANGDLKKCDVARASGAFVETDWSLASKYTDDAVAILAQTAADEAKGQAAGAMAILTDLASDSKLTPGEKQFVKRDWDVIVAEVPDLDNQATTIGGVSEEKAAFDGAYSALNTYITPLLADLTTTSTIVGGTFRSNFKVYYEARTNLLNAIAVVAKDRADDAYNLGYMATLAVRPDQIRATVGQVGGTNMLYNSSFRKQPPVSSQWGSPSTFAIQSSGNDNGYLKMAQGTAAAFGYVTEGSLTLVNGQDYTLQFEAWGDGPINVNYIYIMSAELGNVKLSDSFAVDTTATQCRVVFTATKAYTDAKILIGVNMSPVSVANVLRLRRIFLAKGDVISSWTPNPNEMKNSSVTITDSSFEVETGTFSVHVRDPGSNEDNSLEMTPETMGVKNATIDSLTLTGTVKTGTDGNLDIHQPGTTIYVGPASLGGSYATPDNKVYFNTWASAMSYLGRRLKGSVTINVQPGTYNENFFIEGFFGLGTLTVNLAGGTANTLATKAIFKGAYHRIRYNSIPVHVVATTSQTNSLYAPCFLEVGGTSSAALTIQSNAGWVRLNGLTITADSVPQALGISYCPGVSVTYTCADGASTYGIYVATASVTLSSTKGTNPGTGLYLDTGGHVIRKGTIVNGATAFTNSGGGYHDIGTITPTNSDGTPVAPPVQTTTQFACDSSRSWRDSYDKWRDETDIYQGNYGYGTHYGCFRFGTAAATLAGKTLISARLYLKREGKGGSSGDVPIKLYTTTLTSIPAAGTAASSPPTIANGTVVANLSWNEGGWYDLPIAFATAAKSGYALCIYNGSSSSMYAIIYGNGVSAEPILEVTYQ